MKDVGINILVFKFYSIRGVVILVVKVVNVFIYEIMNIVGWCLDFIFVKFYDCFIINENGFVEVILLNI